MEDKSAVQNLGIGVWEKLRTVENVDVRDKKVLVRVDFNLPLDEKGEVTDDSRLAAALPTIRYLLERSRKVILMSHLGRPKGKVVENLRLNCVASRLEELLARKVRKLDNCIGPEVAAEVNSGFEKVLLLENLRFHPEEEANDRGFAKSLADLADVYINDAFGTAHRAHASTTGITDFLPSAAGFLMEKEIKALGRLLADPPRPFIVILGGAKVADKIGVMENLLGKVDAFLLGGGIANTFLKAGGFELGASLVDETHLQFACDFLKKAKEKGVKIELPVDLVAVDQSAEEAQVLSPGKIPPGWKALDIGPQSAENYAALIKKTKTVFWNGPLGVFEEERFAHGSETVAQAVATPGIVSVVGGGDTLALLEKMDIQEKVTHASTGGGASLEFLEGKMLPGVFALIDK